MAMFPTTCSIYRHNPPTGSPVATDVPLYISGTYQCGSYQVTPLLRPWTYIAEFDLDVDIRDSYPGQAGSWLLANADSIVLDDPAGVSLVVIMVEEYVNSSNNRVQRVFLDRLTVDWPIVRE